MRSKRILAINDLSGFSHTSLMAMIPVFSSVGMAVAALPTAVLSSNTEHSGYQIVDMTPYLKGFLKHWSELELSFDAICSGFLYSAQQTEIVTDALKLFKGENTLIVVDPVMADDGMLYPCFSQSIVSAMRKLIRHADLITPNQTEAALLLNESHKPILDSRTAKIWCRRLSEEGPRQIAITNVQLAQGKKTSVVCYDRKADKFHRSTCAIQPVNYPGTGDVFTSVLTGLLLRDADFFIAVDKAVQFCSKAIELTIMEKSPSANGVCLEKALHLLPKLMKSALKSKAGR